MLNLKDKIVSVVVVVSTLLAIHMTFWSCW